MRGLLRQSLKMLLLMPLCAIADDRSLAERQVPLDVPRTSGTVTIDAVLDEAAWQQARRVTLDFETWPAENIAARARTEAFVTHDDENLYVAFVAHDPDPSRIRAHLTDRDRMFQDDHVGVVLDTFNDQRRGFEFFVNPLGVQGDLFIDDVNGGESVAYNAIWDSAGRITDEGYIVEMALPFRSLRFRNGDEDKVWGIEFTRIWPRDERHQFRAYRADRNLACYLCEFQKFRGFGGVETGNNLELTPTATVLRTRERADYGEPLAAGDTEVEPGLNMSWGITPNVFFNATLNPDFSQVEADSALLDVNNQFALFFPERRPFFLEGQDLFNDVFDLVYTRNIADPDYGAKVTGKEGAHGFGAFVTDDQVTNLILPGPQGNDHDTFEFASSNAAARYRYDLGSNSAVGVLATKREGSGYRNAVYAADAFYRFTGSNSIKAEFAGSRSEYPDAVTSEYDDVPTGILSDTAWHLQYERNKREYWLVASHRDIGEDFRADLGFLPQVGYRRSLLGGGYSWFGEEDDWYRKWRLSGDVDITHDEHGLELEREGQVALGINAGMQSFNEVGVVRRRKFYDGDTYWQTLYSYYGEMRPSGSVAFGAYVRAGDAIDYDNSRAGEERVFEPWVNLRLGRHLELGLDWRYQQLDVASGRLFTAEVMELRATWQFSTRLFVRWITQFQDVRRDPALYVDAVDTRSRDWGNQLLVSYKVNPRTLFHIGVSDGQEAIDGDPFERQAQTVFMKFSYAWQL